MESAQTLQIRLKGADNWAAWKFQTQIIMRGRGIFDLVEGTRKCPIKESDSSTMYDEWVKQDARAQELIVTRIEEEPLTYLFSCSTSCEMWKKLTSIYDKESIISVHLLQQKFFNMAIESSESMAKYFTRIDEVKLKLKLAGEAISDNMVITKILMTLPDKYKHFRSAWESVHKEQQTLSELISRLLLEEERFNSTEETVALTVSQNNSSKPNLSTTIKCFNCGKTGHFAKSCYKKETRECYNCKKKGHIASQCRMKLGKKNKGTEYFNAFLMTTENTEESVWYMDTGASEHMCGKKYLFKSLSEGLSLLSVRVGKGELLQVCGVGTVELYAWNGEKYIKTVLSNVLYVPDLSFNLFSAGYVLDKGLYLTSNSSECHFINKFGEIRAIGKRQNKLYRMDFLSNLKSKLVDNIKHSNVKTSNKVSECSFVKSDMSLFTSCLSSKVEKLSEWHSKFAHINFEQVKSILRKNNIAFNDDSQTYVCEKCLAGKQHRISFPLSESRAKERLELVHADVCGPMEQESIGGSRYFLLLKDDYSSYRFVYFMRHKSEVKKYIQAFINQAENETGCKLKVLRSDNGLEFINKELKDVLEKKGITHQTSVTYTPQQNGRAERDIRTLVESARASITGLHKKFWAEAISVAAYTLNRVGKSSIPEMTPYEAYYKQKASIDNLKEFGTKVSVHIPKQKRQKLDSKNSMGIFVGYGANIKGYRVYFEKINDVKVVCDVIFLPKSSLMQSEIVNERGGEESKDYIYTEEPQENEREDEDVVNTESKPECVDITTHKIIELESDSEEEIYEDTVQTDEQLGTERELVTEEEDETNEDRSHYNLRSRRRLKLPDKYDNFHMSLLCECPSYDIAINSIESERWREAMNKELKALAENNTWQLVPKPTIYNPIDCKWVFRYKSNNVYKARLVARGFQQCNLGDVYSPVARLTSVRMFFAFCNENCLLVHQLDVCSAFLNGDITNDVYITLPKGCESVKVNVNQCIKLKKSLYGLKESPKNWNSKFTITMKELGFQQSEFEYCLFIKCQGKDKTFLLLYVDDLLLASTNEKNIIFIKNKLSTFFKMKDIGLVSEFLGIKVKQNIENQTIVLCQKEYLQKLLEKCNMSECNFVSTPMQENFDHSVLKRDSSESKEVEKRCRAIIGSLMYAMLCTRPDLCLAISVLSRYQSCASTDLWNAFKHVLRYIKGTLELNLLFCKGGIKHNNIVGYVDSDWAGDRVDRKSTGGFVFKCFNCSVSWGSRKQATTALSSTESEFMALSLATSEACWLRNLFKDFQGIYVKITLYEDNQSVIKLCNNPQFHHRLKHIDIKGHFIREKIRSHVIDLLYINSENQIADVFTKPLGKVKFVTFRKQLGIL